MKKCATLDLRALPMISALLRIVPMERASMWTKLELGRRSS